MHPAGLSVAESHVVRALAAATVHQHNRIGMANLRGKKILHVHLTGDDVAVGHLLQFGPDPEVALLGQLQRDRVGILLGRGRFRGVCGNVFVNPLENRL